MPAHSSDTGAVHYSTSQLGYFGERYVEVLKDTLTKAPVYPVPAYDTNDVFGTGKRGYEAMQNYLNGIATDYTYDTDFVKWGYYDDYNQTFRSRSVLEDAFKYRLLRADGTPYYKIGLWFVFDTEGGRRFDFGTGVQVVIEQNLNPYFNIAKASDPSTGFKVTKVVDQANRGFTIDNVAVGTFRASTTINAPYEVTYDDANPMPVVKPGPVDANPMGVLKTKDGTVSMKYSGVVVYLMEA